MKILVSEEDYRLAVEMYTGWCTNCNEFTRGETEPDAEGYYCPVCERHTVMGAEEALLTEVIEIK